MPASVLASMTLSSMAKAMLLPVFCNSTESILPSSFVLRSCRTSTVVEASEFNKVKSAKNHFAQKNKDDFVKSLKSVESLTFQNGNCKNKCVLTRDGAIVDLCLPRLQRRSHFARTFSFHLVYCPWPGKNPIHERKHRILVISSHQLCSWWRSL